MKGTKEKFTLLNKLLFDEYMIVQVNPAVAGVILPDHLKKESTITLKLSKLFSGGMEITPEKIEANLSFNKQYFCCVIPLDAIWGAVSIKNEVTVWPESAPLDQLKGTNIAPPDKAIPAASKPQLKRIK
jgi:hypothetical protein